MANPLLAIVGPTATGKSALALRLATELGGEVVSADSRQVYRRMDIGTAKPSMHDRAVAPHHLIDVVDPDQEYSLAIFVRQATDAIADIRRRGRLPILAGGTGQYVWALLEGWQVPDVPPDPAHRRAAEEKAALEGAAALYEELSALDPEAASRIDPRNVRRVIRALEVHRSALGKGAAPPGKGPAPYDTVIVGLTLERTTLYRVIDERVDRMLEAGWVQEVRSLLDQGFRPELPSMSSLGYREVVQHQQGELSLAQATARIKQRTHRFARQQYNWFRPGDRRIRWFEASTPGFESVEAEARRVLA